MDQALETLEDIDEVAEMLKAEHPAEPMYIITPEVYMEHKKKLMAEQSSMENKDGGQDVDSVDQDEDSLQTLRPTGRENKGLSGLFNSTQWVMFESGAIQVPL